MAVHAGDDPVFLREALDSMVIQSNRDFSTIIVWDGPLPEELIEQLNNSSLNIIHLKKTENRGLAAALNTALDHCFRENFDFIARMDSDDRMRPARLERQMAYLMDNPEVDVTGTAISEIGADGRERGKVVEYPADHESCFRFFRFRDPLAHPSVMFRARYFEKAGIYDESLRKNQDTELWYRGFKNGCVFANMHDVLMEFRMTEDFFRKRRGGKERARQLYRLRGKINRGLGYGTEARLFAGAMYFMALSPAWLRKLAYRLLR